jgi:hypothetical protein
MRQFGGTRSVNGELFVFEKQPLGRQRRNVVADESRWNLQSDRLRFARKRKAHLRGLQDRLFATIRQQVRSQAKIFGGFFMVVEVGDQLGRNRATDANLYVLPALL